MNRKRRTFKRESTSGTTATDRYPEDQREAMSLGMMDGLATREQSPELPFLLIAEYGSESNARHALEDALYKRAGIGGVKTHAGK